MAKIGLIVDTDILIDYLNHGRYKGVLENKEIQVYYSIVTRKELLAKSGLKDSERVAILQVLSDFRLINLDNQIAEKYYHLQVQYPCLAKEDTLIAATCLAKNLPLMTKNWRHYKDIKGLIFFKGEQTKN